MVQDRYNNGTNSFFLWERNKGEGMGVSLTSCTIWGFFASQSLLLYLFDLD